PPTEATWTSVWRAPSACRARVRSDVSLQFLHYHLLEELSIAYACVGGIDDLASNDLRQRIGAIGQPQGAKDTLIGRSHRFDGFGPESITFEQVINGHALRPPTTSRRICAGMYSEKFRWSVRNQT